MKCATHPDVETLLTCGKCGKPICPKCMVMTDVGARCKECAELKRLPTYQVDLRQYIIASVLAIVLAFVLGLAWGFLKFRIPFIGLILGFGVGLATGEVMSLSLNRKRGIALVIIGALSVVAANFWSNTIFSPFSPLISWTSFWELGAVFLGILAVISRLR